MLNRMEKQRLALSSVLLLTVSFLIYSATGIFTKLASMQDPMGVAWLQYLAMAFVALGTYAVLWQFILGRVALSQAFLFKSTTVLFSLCFAYFLFDERISLQNIVGAFLIIVGIILNALTRPA